MSINPSITHPSICLSVHLFNYISIYSSVYNSICPSTIHIPLLFEACVVKRKGKELVECDQNLMLNNIKELPILLVEFDTTSNPREADVGHHHLFLGLDLLNILLTKKLLIRTHLFVHTSSIIFIISIISG